MANLTFVIPVAPYHIDVLNLAIESIKQQTVECEVIIVHDNHQRGAGYARNRGVEQVKTDFVAFLDADDLVAPRFAEATLKAFDGTRYVYCDWFEGERRVKAPECAWINGTWHVITSLLPTAWVREIGGFDETLIGAEDTDFYAHLTRSGRCGKRLPDALFQYRKLGQRSESYRSDSGAKIHINQLLVQRYGGLRMACCGANPDMPESAAGDMQPGDVLAEALWLGNRTEMGRITGRWYPRTGNRKRLWMNPADIDSSPEKFARVVEMPPPQDEEARAAFRRLAHEFMGVNELAPSYDPINDGLARSDGNAELVTEGTTPDVGKVLRLYRNAV